MNEQLQQLAISIANDLAAFGREDILKEAINRLGNGDEARRLATALIQKLDTMQETLDDLVKSQNSD